jgi:hypothetical protein
MSDPASDFEWREIPCASGEEAEAEARRQQAREDPQEVEWIYLHNKEGQWVARRTPRNLVLEEAPPRSGQGGLGWLFDLLFH